MIQCFIVGLGGGLGAFFRYLLGKIQLPAAAFPIHTLCINILGGFCHWNGCKRRSKIWFGRKQMDIIFKNRSVRRVYHIFYIFIGNHHIIGTGKNGECSFLQHSKCCALFDRCLDRKKYFLKQKEELKLEIGKVPPRILEKIVLHPIQNFAIQREDVFVRPKTGEDCSAVSFGEELCVLSADPITGAEKDMGYIAVHINCNDIASSGAEPVGILLTVLLPEESTEDTLSDIMAGAYEAAKEIGIEILGGHTEVTAVVNKPVISAAVIGRTDKKGFIATGGAKEGQDVIMTKWAGLEGTAIIAKEYEAVLSGKIKKEVLENAKSMKGFLSVVKEGKIAKSLGATAMHDVTEGGILGAAWEVAECSEKGILIELEKIPVKEETKAICEAAQISPYELISSGSMIITAFEGEKIVSALAKEGIESTIIGKITKQQKLVLEKGQAYPLQQPKSDALYGVKL